MNSKLIKLDAPYNVIYAGGTNLYWVAKIIKPDYQLENPDEFFDIAKIGQMIEQFYAK